MDKIDVTLPRTQWERIHAAADKASASVSYSKFPGLHMAYVGIYRTVGVALEAHRRAEVTVSLHPVAVNSLHQLSEFQAFREGLPLDYPGSGWLRAS